MIVGVERRGCLLGTESLEKEVRSGDCRAGARFKEALTLRFLQMPELPCSNLKADASLNCVPTLVLALLAAPQFPRGGLMSCVSKNKSEVQGENRTPLGTI